MDEMDEDKKKNKGTISEDDMSLLLPKYSATTIIAVLQEISQSNDVDMDWDVLVKNTSTGITNPREYQMLWRHLAYGHSLAEGIDENSEVLDDDSDLEYELQPYPPTSDEALNEAAACVKVLLASNLSNDSGPPNTSIVEAPLTINIPNGQASCAPSDNPQSSCTQGTNITVPVCVQKQSVAAAPTTTGGLDVNGLSIGSLPPRKKRKPWTPEEDLELIAAVEKYGERNWANIIKGDFKGERSASQLSQRWSIIRKKRQTTLNPAGVTNFTGSASASGSASQLSEVQLAARHALRTALNIPMIDSLSAASSVVPAATNEAPPVSGAPMESSTKPTVSNSFSQAVHQNQQAPHQITTSFQKGTSGTASQAIHQSQQAPHQTTTPFQKGTSGTGSQALNQNQQAPHQTTTSFQKGTSGTAAKSRIITKKTPPIPVKAPVGPNPMIQAAAVAAGARIITSTEASLLKAAQSKNPVHIRPGGGSLIKPALPGSTKPLPPNPGTRPNVHYIRTGLPSASQPPPTFSTVVPSIPQSGCSQQAQGNSVGSAAVTCQVPSAVTASSSLPVAASFGDSGVKSNDAILTVGSGILSVEGVMKSVEEMKVDESTILSTQEEVKSVQKMKVDSSADVVKCSGQDDQGDLPNSDMFINKEVTMENLRNTSQEMEVDEKEQMPVGKLTEKQPAVIKDVQDGTTMQKAGSPCQDETTMMEASSPCQDVTMKENQNHCS